LVFRGARPSPSREDRGPSLRVVSLAPSVTEMLFSLGVGDAVVGVTDYCDYPPEAKRIECVGGFGQPNVEKLLAVAPDVVIAAGLEHPKVAQTLRGAGIRVLDVRIRSIDEMWQGLRQIGQAVGRPQRAEELIAAMQAELAAVSVRHRGTPQAQRPRVFVEIGDHPLTTAGGSSYLDDVIARAGGCNVAHDVAQAYFHVSPEQVIAWNPDFILTARMGQTEDPTAGFSRRIGWGEMSAVKRGAIIHDIPADYLFRPGPRLIEGVKALAQRLQQAPHTTEERPALARGSTSQDRSPLTPTPLPGVPGRGANSTSGISPCP
jgi:iron complex transport system substrate-binding protein